MVMTAGTRRAVGRPPTAQSLSSSSSSSLSLLGTKKPAAGHSSVKAFAILHASLLILVLPLRTSCSAAATPTYTTNPAAVAIPRGRRRVAFVPAGSENQLVPERYLPDSVLMGLRGGNLDDDDDESEDESESDQEEDDDQVSDDNVDEAEVVVKNKKSSISNKSADLDAKLSASAVSSAIKTKVKQEVAKTKAAKSAVNAELHKTTTTVTKKKSSTSYFRVPYVIRAFLNPITVFRMSVAYWASLFDLDYLKRREGSSSSSQELRSALQEKAKFEPSKKKGSGGSGRRQMKRGQSKSLSDLPQLSS